MSAIHLPPVFLAKSAQAIAVIGDTRDCELRRVCNVLKIKDRSFEDCGADDGKERGRGQRL